MQKSTETSKILCVPNKNPTCWSINITLVIFKPDINGVKGKIGPVNPINFCRSFKIFYDFPKFRRIPFLHLTENLLLNRPFLLCFLWCILNIEELGK